MDYMEKWNSFARPPKHALAPITAGRLKGKTRVSPQWRYQAMTEAFGPCGFGWRYTIDRVWTEEGNKGEVFAFASVSLYVKIEDQWSEAIPGIGGSRLRELERSGIHNNDEAYKMATTDALSVAMCRLGVAADIYLDMFDGCKYRDEEDPPPPSNQSPKNSFRAPPDPPKQAEPFQWSTASSSARRERLLDRINKASALPDPVLARKKLEEISAWLTPRVDDLKKADRDSVDATLVAAEAKLNAEASGD